LVDGAVKNPLTMTLLRVTFDHTMENLNMRNLNEGCEKFPRLVCIWYTSVTCLAMCCSLSLLL